MGGRRVIKKIMAKRNWYKSKKRDMNDREGNKKGRSNVEDKSGDKVKYRDETEPETVLFIPSTPRGELLKRMRETDLQYRRGTDMRQIKFVERAGVSLKDTLVSGNPWGDMKCGREDCFV